MAPRKTGMDRVNELLSKVPEYRGALGSYTPLTKPTQIAPVAAPKSDYGTSSDFVQPAAVDPLRGVGGVEAPAPGSSTSSPPGVIRGIVNSRIDSSLPSTPAALPPMPKASRTQGTIGAIKGAGVLVGNKPLSRNPDGSLAMPTPAIARNQATPIAARAVGNAGLSDDPKAIDIALEKAYDSNKVGIGEARVVAPNGQVISGNADQVAASTNSVQNYRPNRVGRTGAGGGIVISNQIDRPSGIIGNLPVRELTKGGLNGPRFVLRPRKGVEEANAVAQGAIGLANTQGGYQERIERNKTEAARSNADAARADAGLERASKESIAKGTNEAAVTVGLAKNLTYKEQLKQRMNTTAFMAQMQQLRDAAKNAVTDADKLAIQQHEDELVAAFQTSQTATQPPAAAEKRYTPQEAATLPKGSTYVGTDGIKRQI